MIGHVPGWTIVVSVLILLVAWIATREERL